MPDASPGLAAGVAAGLDPRPSSLTPSQGIVAQVGPLLAFLVYAGLVIADALGVFHGNSGGVTALLGVLGPVVGAWVRHLGG